MKPRIQLETVVEHIPTHKTVDIVTENRVPVQDCQELLVEDGNGEIYKENASEGELSNLRSIV